MTTFTETQQSRYRWYLLIFVVMLPALVFWRLSGFLIDLLGDELWVAILGLGSYSLFSVCLVCIVAFRKISTHLDQQGIQFRVSPFGKWVSIGWDAIEQVYVREFALVGEYPRGLGGTRQGPNGWAYTLNGTYGLQINKKSGGKILIGTQRPDELQAFLKAHPTDIVV